MMPKYISNDPILTKKEIEEFNQHYAMLCGVAASYGEIIQELMKRKNIDPKKAEFLTGLNYVQFKNLDKPGGAIQKRFVISVAIGFELDFDITECILKSCGLCLNSNDRVDRAYIYILENHKGRDIDECNMVLSQLGVPGNAMLGELERGEYTKHKK